MFVAIEHNPADGWVGDPVVTAAYQYIHDNGVLHFNSAGNGGDLNPLRQAFEQTILVANSDSPETLNNLSNYGTGIDITAPGTSILSTRPGGTPMAPGLNCSPTSVVKKITLPGRSVTMMRRSELRRAQLRFQALSDPKEIYPISTATKSTALGPSKWETISVSGLEYSAEAGIGWQSGSIIELDLRSGNAVRSDSAVVDSAMFLVDLREGLYNLTMTVSASLPALYSIEGEGFEMIPPRRRFVTLTHENVLVSDGQLTLSMQALSTNRIFRLAGLLIENAVSPESAQDSSIAFRFENASESIGAQRMISPAEDEQTRRRPESSCSFANSQTGSPGLSGIETRLTTAM